MKKKIIIYIAVIILLNVVGVLVHQFLLGDNTNTVLSIPKTYIINAMATIIISTVVYLLKDDFENTIGFIFFGMSVLKMIFFFILINPANAKGSVDQADAIIFFVPYLLNMILELVLIVNHLKVKDLVNTLKKDA